MKIDLPTIKTFEQYNSEINKEYDTLPNNKFFRYLQKELKSSIYGIEMGEMSDDKYVDIFDKTEPKDKYGNRNVFYDFGEPFTIDDIQEKIDDYLNKPVPKNPHKSYNDYVDLSKHFKPILDRWYKMSDKEKSKFSMTKEELKKYNKKYEQEPLKKALCIKDCTIYVNDQILSLNNIRNITDPYTLFKEGEIYEHTGPIGSDKIITYVDSKLRLFGREDDPEFMYETFVIRRDDKHTLKIQELKNKYEEIMKRNPNLFNNDSGFFDNLGIDSSEKLFLEYFQPL